MKKILALLLVAAFAIPTFQSCKKYENGPSISFRSKASRVANDWAISSYMEDGVDKTNIHVSDVMTLTKDGGATYKFTDNGATITMTGNWVFDTKKENITFTSTYPRNNGGGTTITVTVVETMKITKLFEKEMWWEGSVTQTLPTGFSWPGTTSSVWSYTAATKFKSK